MRHVREEPTTPITSAGGVGATGTAIACHLNNRLNGKVHGIAVHVYVPFVPKGCGTLPSMRSFCNICLWDGCPIVNRHKIEWRRQLGSYPWTLWGNFTCVKGMWNVECPASGNGSAL